MGTIHKGGRRLSSGRKWSFWVAGPKAGGAPRRLAVAGGPTPFLLRDFVQPRLKATQASGQRQILWQGIPPANATWWVKKRLLWSALTLLLFSFIERLQCGQRGRKAPCPIADNGSYFRGDKQKVVPLAMLPSSASAKKTPDVAAFPHRCGVAKTWLPARNGQPIPRSWMLPGSCARIPVWLGRPVIQAAKGTQENEQDGTGQWRREGRGQPASQPASLPAKSSRFAVEQGERMLPSEPHASKRPHAPTELPGTAQHLHDGGPWRSRTGRARVTQWHNDR